uniref:Uncharacterized protein n=1 Tax=Oryza meridionalis TaxID=40149 RepID=A0A0E0EK81_9ORYZ
MNILAENQQQLRIALKIPPDSQELKWNQKATLKLPKATFYKASHSLGWTCRRGFGQVDMIHNGGTRESSDRLALLRPSKCPTARTDQYPTGHSDDQFFPEEAQEGEEFYGADEFMF